jgi:hypothetical protein
MAPRIFDNCPGMEADDQRSWRQTERKQLDGKRSARFEHQIALGILHDSMLTHPWIFAAPAPAPPAPPCISACSSTAAARSGRTAKAAARQRARRLRELEALEEIVDDICCAGEHGVRPLELAPK